MIILGEAKKKWTLVKDRSNIFFLAFQIEYEKCEFFWWEKNVIWSNIKHHHALKLKIKRLRDFSKIVPHVLVWHTSLEVFVKTKKNVEIFSNFSSNGWLMYKKW